MRNILAGFALACLFVGWSLPANAVVIDVFAQANSTTGGTGAVTGVSVTTGDNLWITVPTNDCWAAGGGNRTTNADGLVSTGFPSCQAAAWNSGNYSKGGLTAPFASLVGSLDGGTTYFLVGTSYNQTVSQSGLLTLWFFDSNSGDNSGSVQATIMNHGQGGGGGGSVPEPGTLALIGFGLAGLGIARRKRKTA